MVTMSLSAQTVTKRPSLVVGIMIDGLNQDYLNHLRHLFGNNGFNRLLREAVILQNVDFGTPLDNIAATAVIHTGTSPSTNGIPCEVVYDYENGMVRPILYDSTKIGNYTNETFSPSALRVSTLSDEIKIDGDGTNYVHSISPNAFQAIVMSGHASNSAFWINNETGKWATTTYYKDVPTSIVSRNYSKPLSSRIDTMAWTPSLSLNQYPDIPEHRHIHPFRYIFSKKDKSRYLMFKSSACVNNEITSVASDYISEFSLGHHPGTVDMLNISYTLIPYPYSYSPNNKLETMDAYIKLDRNIEQLFSAIERTAGMDNTLVFISGTPPRPRTRRDDERWNIPQGQFSARRATSLLNMYLMAKHGSGEWVKKIHNNNLYLNHDIIKAKRIDIKNLRQDIAQFITRMSGIDNAYTIDDITTRQAGENPDALRRNTTLKYAGDIIFTLAPGWEIIDSETYNIYTNVTRAAQSTSMVLILAPDTKAQTISTPIDARVIAPTISRLLRIRSPNASSMSPLYF